MLPIWYVFFICGYSILGLGGLIKFTQLLPYLSRLQPESLEHSEKLFEKVYEIATKKGYTISQLALACVHQDVCPISRTTKIENFNQNIKSIVCETNPEEMAELEYIAAADRCCKG